MRVYAMGSPMGRYFITSRDRQGAVSATRTMTRL